MILDIVSVRYTGEEICSISDTSSEMWEAAEDSSTGV